MLAKPTSFGSHVLLAVSLAICAAATWMWQAAVFRTKRPQPKGERWQVIQEQFPEIGNGSELPVVPAATLEAVIQANPFSPLRRQQVATETSSGSGATNQAPPPPKWVYKGRVDVGQRQRAVIEDTATRKTYFLEMGQEAAGFKVLDIAERQVVLSDPQTGEAVTVSLTKTP